MRGARIGFAFLAISLCTGCVDERRYDQAICALVDVSGTYADQKADVVRILKREILPEMLPGDTLIVIRIDSESYDKDNLEVITTLDARPSRANAQKLALAGILDKFAERKDVSEHTDIPGAMMLGAEYLRELGSGSQQMLVFSDMAEDLPEGAKRQMASNEFEGIRVVAMNVKRLDGDTADPGEFRARLASWEERVTASGATAWLTIQDDAKLASYLSETR